jgi:hypothetical protein
MHEEIVGTAVARVFDLAAIFEFIMDGFDERALYQALLALPLMPRDIFCPLGTPSRYELTFSRHGTVLFLAAIGLAGCQSVLFGDGRVHTTLGLSTFRPQLADTLGVPESELYQSH